MNCSIAFETDRLLFAQRKVAPGGKAAFRCPIPRAMNPLPLRLKQGKATPAVTNLSSTFYNQVQPEDTNPVVPGDRALQGMHMRDVSATQSLGNTTNRLNGAVRSAPATNAPIPFSWLWFPRWRYGLTRQQLDHTRFNWNITSNPTHSRAHL